MRRAFAICIVIVVVAHLATTPIAGAQTVTKIHRVGWLSSGSTPPGANPVPSDFQRGMRDLGYVVGQNVVIEFRESDGNTDRLSDLATELARMPVDVIITAGDAAALAAGRATKTVPIVATEFGLDPVKAGLVASFARPEGNVTGLASISEDLWNKRLSMLKEMTPMVTRLVALWNPTNPGNTICVEELRTAARAQGIQLQAIEVRNGKTLDQALEIVTREPSGAIVICLDSVTLAHAKTIADFALARQFPTLAPLKEYVRAGALLSYGASLPAQRRRTAHYVTKILKGAKPSDLPVETPTSFELVVNLTSAKALGLALPPGIALLADDVLE